MPSFSFWVFVVLNFTKKNQQRFFFQDPIGPIFFIFYFVFYFSLFYLFFWTVSGRGEGTITPGQIEVKFCPQVVLIVVQMPFKVF